MLPVFAQFTVDTELRPRLEFRDGYQRLQPAGADPVVFTSQRTRLSFGYETENLKIKITPQDVRVWGSEQNAGFAGVNGDYASFDMFEGYFEARIKNNAWISAGRQQLVYDNQWLLGARNWNQHGNSVDAFVFKAKPKGINIHAGVAWNAMKEELHNQKYPCDRLKSLNYLWLNRRFLKNNQISLIYMATGVTQNDTSNVLYFRHTTGIFAEHKSEKLFASANAYYQTGVNQTGQNVSAYFGAADVKYIKKKFFAGLGISYVSGNKFSATTNTTDHLFYNVFNAKHGYLGSMDYFRYYEPDTWSRGIVDYNFSLKYSLTNKLELRNMFHYFQLPHRNLPFSNEKGLGFENDFILKYNIHDWGVLELGYCFFLPEENLRLIHNVPNNKFSQFVYMQMIIKTSVFSSAKDNE